MQQAMQQPVVQTVAVPCRLSVVNLHPSITESDLRPIFEPFGALDFLTLERDPVGHSTGMAFVQ